MKQYRPHLFVLCVLAVVLLTGAHNTLHNALMDARFSLYPREASGEIVLVAIDPPSMEKIGVWPWPRRLHAELIGKLESAGVSDIVFDVDFSSPSNPTFDEAFADALQKAGGSVVLPSFKQLVRGRGNEEAIYVNRPLPRFGKHAWPATVNVVSEPDGLVRRYSFGETLDGEFLPAVGALLVGRYEKNEKSFLIDFSIRADSVPMVSYVDVLRGDTATAKMLKGKKVIIGGTAVDLGDRFNVPNGHVISGPKLQILAAESILQGRVLRTSSDVVTLGGLGIIVLSMVLLWRRFSVSLRIVALTGLAVAAESGAFALQAKFPVILDTSVWHAAIVIYFAAMALDEIDVRGLLASIAAKRFQRIAMSLGDGLVCADRNGLITVWNPAAVAIFGYEPEEMAGRPFDTICAGEGSGKDTPFSILNLAVGALQAPGGKVIELKGRRKNGETFPLEACFSGWLGTEGLHYGAVLRDISVRKREEEHIRHLAEYDTLTGLPNRNTLHKHLGASVAEAQADQCEVALLLMDLDKFKEINDTLGHACGDQALCAVAKGLSALVEGSGLVARLGGDEFAIVISGSDVADRAKKLSERAALAFSKNSISLGERSVRVTGSIGVAIYPEHCGTVEELIANADLALYRAKATGRGTHVFYDFMIREELEARLLLEAGLRQAVERGEFELFYQPQINLADGRLVGAEALIRWRHPDRGLVSPAEFMQVINTSSISDRVALWAMATACKQGRLWQQNGHNVRISVNLSPSQFQSGDLAETVRTVLKDTGFSPSLLELEVTEGVLIEDDKAALDIFRRIQKLGVQIAFDDFGTGYASLTYLKKFPFDRLKIDQSFVRELRAGSDDAAIVGTLISLSRLLGLAVIAEGIEDSATADHLVKMGCEEGQGYYFGRPMTATEFEHKFLSEATLLKSGAGMAETNISAA